MTAEGKQHLAAFSVPYKRGFVFRGSDDASAVRTKAALVTGRPWPRKT